MGYLYLAIALAGGLTKGLVGKKVSGDMRSFRDCLFINLMRMVFCMVIGVALVAVQPGLVGLTLTGKTIGICVLSALGMSTFCVCWMYAYRTEAYIFLNVFTMLGSFVTCTLGLILYRDPIGWHEWLGMGILLAAVLTMSRYNRELKGKFTPRGILILVLGCTGSAVADFSQRMYMLEVGESPAVYNALSYTLAAVLLAVVMALLPLAGKPGPLTPALSSRRSIALYFVIAACLFINSTFKTMAAGLLTTAQLYPVLQGANLIASGLAAQVFFREKINRKSVIGMALAFAGLMVMRLL